MDIHKPKAAHSWREFLVEIGTIICGILIALSLEQAIEALHWAETVREAKASIHEELTLATLFADERLARKACADAYLDGLSAAVAASPDAWRPVSSTYCGLEHTAVYRSLWRPWPTEVWRSLEAAGSVPHFEPRYRQQAPFTFSFVVELGELGRQERALANDLQPLAYPIRLTPDARIAFLKTLAALKALNDQAQNYSGDLKGNIRELGETPSAAELEAERKKIPNYFLRPGVLLNPPGSFKGRL